MKKYLLLLALVCLLGNRALAQGPSKSFNYDPGYEVYDMFEMKSVNVIDFTGFRVSYSDDGGSRSHIDWDNAYITSVYQEEQYNGNTWTTKHDFLVNGKYKVYIDDHNNDNDYNNNDWNSWGIGLDDNQFDSQGHKISFLSLFGNPQNGNSPYHVYIGQLKKGDVVKIWFAGNRNSNNAGYAIEQSNVYSVSGSTYDRVITMNQDGTIDIKFTDQYAGIHQIEITSNNVYNTNNAAGFNLAGSNAKYMNLVDTYMSLNNRVAVSTTQGWTFARGLRAPNYDLNNNNWYNFSICNLKEGDRVEIFWTGDAPTFSSQGQNSAYNGCSAYLDQNGDGILNNGDHMISQGESLVSVYERNEGTIGQEEGVQDFKIYTSSTYVIDEDGHLDIGIRNGNRTRIVKIKVYSDHQATMIDETFEDSNTGRSSRAFFDITGELQAKEHIMPGGLEIRVGNEDKSQHAIVVASKEGPVSYVNAVDGFKLPGITGSVQNGIQINFDLGKNNNPNSIPTSGTFYKFMPEEDGTMKVRFTPNSMYYYTYTIPGNAIYYDNAGWDVSYDRANEQTVNRTCPYYVKVTSDGNTFSDVDSDIITWTNGSELMNGAEGEVVIKVEAGKTYYLFGGWTSKDDYNNGWYSNTDYIRRINNGTITPDACGVAELFDVTFTAQKQVYPLAKWVPNGRTFDENLATIIGYNQSELTVKKMSDNIKECEPYIDNNTNTLKIRNIVYKDEKKDKAGVILIKIGSKSSKTDPVYAFTIAYDANYHSDASKYNDDERGHTWDFSSKSLQGLDWDDPWNANGAVATNFDNYFTDFFGGGEESGVNIHSFLYEEMNDNSNGVTRSNWLFNYRQQQGEERFDPRFLCKYDMEGDNADMIWTTEGIIIQASGNQSCMFNEFLGDNIHASNTNDPDRYVGILPGGKFIIPHLEKDDRVIIYMGSGTGSGKESMRFKISNALDALHNKISPTDEYWAGGSVWNCYDDSHKDPYYRGCYHFFAEENGDMTFDLVGGSMCKLYKIQIYHGDRIYTNNIQDMNNGGYFMISDESDINEENNNAGQTKSWNLHYRGKGEQLAYNSGKNNQNNEIIAFTGKISNTNLTTSQDENNKYTQFSYTNKVGDIGTLRVRAKCMEYNDNYVTDFADRNMTIAYHQKQSYPYTWDFTDINGFSSDDIANEWSTNLTNSTTIERNKPYEAATSSYYNLSLWDAEGNMRLNSQTKADNSNFINQTGRDSKGNQLWANGKVIPETQGLWFYMDSNDPTYNASMQIREDGLRVANDKNKGGQGWWNYRVVVPSVPAGAAVYMRAERDESVGENDYTINSKEEKSYFLNKSFTWSDPETTAFATTDGATDIANIGSASVYTCRYLQTYGNINEYIIAIQNTTNKVQDLTIRINGFVLKKLAVSTDPKKLNIRGWATESRDHVIDPELTAYLTGKDIETCVVTRVNYAAKTITLQRVYSSANNTNPSLVMSSLTDGDKGASILHNRAVTTLSADDGEVNILDGGFHLFVPDMHDYGFDKENKYIGQKSITDNSSMLVAQVSNSNGERVIPAWSNGFYTNYALTYKYRKLYADGTPYGSTITGDEAFYRIAAGGASSSGNQGYLPLLTEYVDPHSSSYGNNPNNNAKFSIIFEEEFEVNSGIATQIENVESTGRETTTEGFYNLNGQKINGIPTQKGMYIVNGKKVLVK